MHEKKRLRKERALERAESALRRLVRYRDACAPGSHKRDIAQIDVCRAEERVEEAKEGL